MKQKWNGEALDHFFVLSAVWDSFPIASLSAKPTRRLVWQQTLQQILLLPALLLPSASSLPSAGGVAGGGCV